jgi:hypothetical protein
LAGSLDASGRAPALDPSLHELFHRLANQLGAVLAQAELLESRAVDDVNRSGAAQVVSSVLGALTTVKAIRLAIEDEA